MKSMASLLLGAAAGLLAAGAVCTQTLRAEAIPADCQTGGFAIGCQAWSFHQSTVFEAIARTAAAGGKVIEFFPGQRLSPDNPAKFDHNSPDTDIALVQAQLAKYHLRPVNYGVVPIPADEAGARKVFDFAKKLGLYGITTESTGSIDTIEKLVKEYDLHVGFHDHPKRAKDPSYRNWDPNFILSVVQGRDARIGACADTGHWVRSGLDPVQCLHILDGRIMSSHLKDLNEMSPKAHDVPYGTGVSDIPAILEELKRQHFAGNISVEYEAHVDNNVAEIAQCIGFVRGYAAGKQ
jgi:sugar phosphate isomerase/epimerase